MQLVAAFPTCGEASDAEAQHPDVYGLFIIKPSGCAMSKTATSMLLKAESTMQDRLRAIGRKKLQVVVVAAGSQLSDSSASSSAAAFKSYLAGLAASWRAVPLPEAEPMRRILAEQCMIECGLKGSAVATSPQLLLLDSSGRVLVGEGFRHLSLDRNAVAFPWSGSVTSANASAVQHLLSPLLLPRAVQSSRLCALLLLPSSSKDMSVAEQVRFTLLSHMCNLRFVMMLIPRSYMFYYYSTVLVDGQLQSCSSSSGS
jgi:hypothetical protein